MSYAVVIPARNEEKRIHFTLNSLKKQSIQPKKIVVIDDGSTDLTAFIAYLYTPYVFTLKDCGYSKLGKPELAHVFNVGFKECKKYDFVFVSGADCEYPNNYVQRLIKIMNKNPRLVMLSGIPENEKVNKTHVSGAGRLIRSSFFHQIGFKYPLVYGWESIPLFEAQWLGYQCCSIPITFRVYRKSGTNITNYMDWGRGMRTLGYWFPMVWARTIVFAKRYGVRSALQLIAGYYSLYQTPYSDELKQSVKQKQIGYIKR